MTEKSLRSVSVTRVPELPDRDAVGQFDLRPYPVSPEREDIEGIVQRFAAKVVRVFLGGLFNQAVCNLPRVQRCLPAHLPQGRDRGRTRVDLQRPAGEVEPASSRRIDEKQFHIVRHVDPALRPVRASHSSSLDYGGLVVDLIALLQAFAIRVQIVRRHQGLGTESRPLLRILVQQYGHASRVHFQPVAELPVPFAYLVHHRLARWRIQVPGILVPAVQKPLAIVGFAVPDVYLASPVVRELRVGKVDPRVHDPLVMFYQALVLQGGGIRVPRIPECRPARFPFPALRQTPCLQFFPGGHVGQVPVYLLLLVSQRVDVGLKRALQQVVLFLRTHGNRIELQQKRLDQVWRYTLHLCRQRP